MSKKQQVLLKLYNYCKRQGNYVFDNEDVKRFAEEVRFKNIYDVTKADNTKVLPRRLLKDDVFVVHLGEGRHQFIKGIEEGYHIFERVPTERRRDWEYRRSILNAINTSESNILSVVFNQRIVHDFLYGDITASPKVYGAHRTNRDIDFIVGTQSLTATNVQAEIDFTLEHEGTISIFEAKNGFPADFYVLQLFNPLRYYRSITEGRQDVKSVQCVYLLRRGNRIRLYLYEFTDLRKPGSIRLVRNSEYKLVER